MPSINEYYRAYVELSNKLEKISDFQKLNKDFDLADADNDQLSGTMIHREVDLEWVMAMEETLPYIDQAIREQRRFIQQIEEVVPIEKSRRITTESVRHLAQHTNMIGRVEGDMVTPKEILNIRREESFDIYENRFLRTLIVRASRFIENIYGVLCQVDETSFAHILLGREVTEEKKMLSIKLECDMEYLGDEKNCSMSQDVSLLTDFQRVERLRWIFADFLATPLMKNLAPLPEVRNPINRTNMLTKDPNFRETIKLWEFLDNYEKTGYSIVRDDDSVTMKAGLKKSIYDMFCLLQFVIKLNLSEKYKDTLKTYYEAELKAEAEEAKWIEQERKNEEKKRIEEAVLETEEKYKEHIAACENKTQQYQKIILSCEQKIVKMNQEREELCLENKAIKKDYEEMQKEYEKKIEYTILKAEQEKANIKKRYKNAPRRYNRKVIMALILVFMLGISLTSLVVAWFINQQETRIEDFSFLSAEATGFRLSLDSTEFDTKVEMDIPDNLSLTPVSGNGQTLYLPYVQQGMNVEDSSTRWTLVNYSSSDEDINAFFKQTIYFRAVKPGWVKLKNIDISPMEQTSSEIESDISRPISDTLFYRVDHTNGWFSKDYIVAATRVLIKSGDEGETGVKNILFIPKDKWMVNLQKDGRSVLVSADEDAESVKLEDCKFYAGSQIGLYSELSNTSIIKESKFTSDQPISRLSYSHTEGGIKYYEGSIDVYLWIEGFDNEAISALADGRMSFNMEFTYAKDAD